MHEKFTYVRQQDADPQEITGWQAWLEVETGNLAVTPTGIDANTITLDELETYGSECLKQNTATIKVGDEVLIGQRGVVKMVRVESAVNWGTVQDPDWYIEGREIDIHGKDHGPVYGKQKYDGLTVEKPW